jgi:hypothetical protein
MPWRIPHRETPDPEKAKAELKKVREQRPDVDRLVEALRREQRLNSFTANVTVILKGGRDGRHA